jgi:hypothetical protein
MIMMNIIIEVYLNPEILKSSKMKMIATFNVGMPFKVLMRCAS